MILIISFHTKIRGWTHIILCCAIWSSNNLRLGPFPLTKTRRVSPPTGKLYSLYLHRCMSHGAEITLTKWCRTPTSAGGLRNVATVSDSGLVLKDNEQFSVLTVMYVTINTIKHLCFVIWWTLQLTRYRDLQKMWSRCRIFILCLSHCIEGSEMITAEVIIL